MRQNKMRLGLIILGLLTSTSAAFAGPQTFNSALPVAKGQFIFREQLFYKKSSDDPSPQNRNLEVTGGISVLAYGLTGDLALFGVLPYLDKKLRLTTLGGRISRKTSGFGDARLFARYTAFQKDSPGKSLRIAPFAGVKLPTGKDNATDSLGRLPAPLQLGSGSWDPFIGTVLTYQTLQYEIDLSASYKANTRANGFEAGDEARLDASLQYRLWPQDLGSGVPGFLYGVLEANLIYRGKNRINGLRDANSGGTTVFIAPGLQYVTRRWVAEAIVQLPLSQNLNGTGLGDDFTLRTGFRVNF
ncbi:hypothetical protein MNBD_ALPHA07-259 [hydrothermal vent metagenome]|uniref:Transporter n=1 Tax=hydrothermal vent metagenome TaxID=652676 RepID=A0A3B0S4U1_9ZZZZ